MSDCLVWLATSSPICARIGDPETGAWRLLARNIGHYTH